MKGAFADLELMNIICIARLHFTLRACNTNHWNSSHRYLPQSLKFRKPPNRSQEKDEESSAPDEELSYM